MKCRHRERALVLGGLLLSALVFEGWPELDLWVTRWFHAGQGQFPANEAGWVQVVYVGVPWLGRLLLVLSLGVLAWAVWRREQVSRRWWRRGAAMALVLSLGLGAVVHGVFKEHWGRPRPNEVTAFHGPYPFQPALHPSSYCDRNCSFVSGHAATGYVLMALGVFGARATRRRWCQLGLLAGLGIGLVRVAQGRHFASDIVFGAFIMWGLTWLLREVWLRVMVWRRTRRRSPAPLQAHPAQVHAVVGLLDVGVADVAEDPGQSPAGVPGLQVQTQLV